MAFFNVDAYKIDTLSVKRKIKYAITSGMPIFRFFKTTILPALDSLYRNQQIKYFYKIWESIKQKILTMKKSH
jgi:hypothetical protein